MRRLHLLVKDGISFSKKLLQYLDKVRHSFRCGFESADGTSSLQCIPQVGSNIRPHKHPLQ